MLSYTGTRLITKLRLRGRFSDIPGAAVVPAQYQKSVLPFHNNNISIIHYNQFHTFFERVLMTIT